MRFHPDMDVADLFGPPTSAHEIMTDLGTLYLMSCRCCGAAVLDGAFQAGVHLEWHQQLEELDR